MESINTARQRVWQKQPEDYLQQAFIDTDGTLGECKGGMALSYKAIWSYAQLISLWPIPAKCFTWSTVPAMRSVTK